MVTDDGIPAHHDDFPANPTDSANDSLSIYFGIIRSRRLRIVFGWWQYHVSSDKGDSMHHIILIRRCFFGIPTPFVDQYRALKPIFNGMQAALISAIRNRRPFTFGQLTKAMRIICR